MVMLQKRKNGHIQRMKIKVNVVETPKEEPKEIKREYLRTPIPPYQMFNDFLDKGLIHPNPQKELWKNYPKPSWHNEQFYLSYSERSQN